MTGFRILAVSISWAALASPLLDAGDLSKYREFQIGTDLQTIAGQVQMDPSRAKVIYRRPALIQDLNWRVQPLGPSTQAEAVSEVVFSFYNDQLYRISVNYDRYKTEGLTAGDLIEAISATQGTATRAAAEIMLPSVYGNDETLEVLARWEDAEYSFNLVRFSHQPNFTLVGVSKRRDPLARAAVIEAVRLDAEEAPQREIESQRKQAEASRAQQEKTRLANKPSFRL
jgi:hypothetical protein